MMNRRERKKNHTRQSLVDAALALFELKGFDATTTEDISEAADVSQRTFFRHFPVKESVLYADMEDYIADAEFAILNSENGDIVKAVRAVILELAASYQTPEGYRMHKARLKLITPSILAHGGVVQTQWINALTDAIAKRLQTSPYEDLFPGMLASVAVGALWVASTRWVMLDEQNGFVQLVETAFDLVSFNQS